MTGPDINLTQWILSWDWHTLSSGSLDLFRANIFHPAPASLAASEHMLGYLPVFGPVLGITGNGVFAFQMHLLMCFALTGVAIYALLLHWGAGRSSALLAAAAFVYGPTIQGFAAHSHLIGVYYLPLAIISFDRTLGSERTEREARVGWAVLFGVALLLQMLCSYYLAFMTVFALATYGFAALWVRRGRVPIRGVMMLAATSIAALVIFAVISLPYIRSETAGLIPSYRGTGRIILYGSGLWKQYWRGGPFYLGMVMPVLCLGAIGWSRFGAASVRWAALGMAAIAGVSYVLGLGPELRISGERWTLPYAWALDVVPGFSAMRVPRRFSIFVSLAVCCLGGLGIECLMQRTRLGSTARAALVGVVSLFVAWDYDVLGLEHVANRPPLGDQLPPIYRTIATLPVGPLLELPVGGVGVHPLADSARESERTVISAEHWFPLLNGYSGYAPPSYEVAVAMTQVLPDPTTLRLLRRSTGLRYILVHTDEMRPVAVEPWRNPHGLVAVARAGGDWLFEVEKHVEADLIPLFLDGSATKTIAGTPVEILPESGRRAHIEFVDRPSDPVTSRSILPLYLRVTNDSDTIWPGLAKDPDLAVMVACRWLRKPTKEAPLVGRPMRGPSLGRLPRDLKPGESVEVGLRCFVPMGRGDHELTVEVRQGEHVFPRSLGSTTIELKARSFGRPTLG